MKLAETFKHFIIGGAQRCGTSYLAAALAAHPQIRMAEPSRPEPKYFLRPGLDKTGLSQYYREFFSGEAGDDLILYGEKSTSYIESADAAGRIKQLLPDARLIFVLREPIQRALSNIAFSRRHGYETEPADIAILRELKNPENTIRAEQAGISVSPQSYLGRGYYAKYLKPYIGLFGRGNIHISLMENLMGSLDNVHEIYRFLGVDDDVEPDMIARKINAGDDEEAEIISGAVRVRLETRFKPMNQELETLTDLDLAPWK